jgi:hypothetical protein
MKLLQNFMEWYRYEAPQTRAAIHRGARPRRGVADERAVSAMLALGWANCGIKNGPTKAWCREAFYYKAGKFVRDYYASHGFYPHGDHCLHGHTVPIHFGQRESRKEPEEEVQ